MLVPVSHYQTPILPIPSSRRAEAIATKLGRGSFRNDSLSLSSKREASEIVAIVSDCWSDGALLAKLARRTIVVGDRRLHSSSKFLEPVNGTVSRERGREGICRRASILFLQNFESEIKDSVDRAILDKNAT